MIDDYFQSGPNRLHFRYYPVENSRAVCMTLHGHGEHSGRYAKFQSILAAERVSFAILEFRGQGSSEGRDVYLDSLQDYLDDVTAFRAFLQERFSVREKVILHGNSLGGLVAVYWALKNPEKIRAMVLTSPCLGLGLPEFLVKFNSWMSQKFPAFLYRNPVYPPHLTHSPEEMEIYKKDPLIKRRISSRLVHEMIFKGRQLLQMDRFEFPFPVYMLIAGLERVVDGGKAEGFFNKIKAPEKDMQVFQNFYHEIFHELDQDLAYTALQSYMRRICEVTGRE
jgi:alpha-beta hydrolase superfamily lysophospholipase